MIGEVLGNYKVLSKIGQGGMGAVYMAEHTVMGRRAAVKVLLPECCSRPDAVTRFFNEAKATANLNHPALVNVFDCGTHAASGSAYLVMDFLAGETLGSRLRKTRKLEPAEAVSIARQIADGLAVAHEAGIVHRDLKPENVFLTPISTAVGRTEVVKILDFGVAKLVRDDGAPAGATRTGTVIGTPLFMAPEQCRGGREIDGRADLYSLGCMLYTMLCGRPPFDYEFAGELIGAHIHEAPTSIGEIEASIPVQLGDLVMATLEKSPERRPQKAAALIRALDGCLGAVERSARATTTSAPPAVPDGPSGATTPTHPDPQEATRLLAPEATAPSPYRHHTTLSSTAVESRAPAPRTELRRHVAAAAGMGVGLVLLAVFLMARPSTQPPRTEAETSDSVPVAVVRPEPPVPTPSAPTQQEAATTEAAERDPGRAAVQAGAAPVGARTTRLRLSSTPEGATVVDVQTGAALGTTPLDQTFDPARTTVKLSLTKRGHRPTTVDVDVSADQVLKIELAKIPRSAKASNPAPPPPPAPPRAEDPDRIRKL